MTSSVPSSSLVDLPRRQRMRPSLSYFSVSDAWVREAL